MFKKQPTLGTNTSLRSSSRRQVIGQVCTQYNLEQDQAKELCPDPLKESRLETHLGTRGTLYLNGNGDPLWFVFGISKGKGPAEGELIPTVNTMIVRPTLLPTVITHPHVVRKLIGGADLFSAGLVSSAQVATLPKGTIVAVSIPGCSIPLGVGRLSKEFDASSRKGKCVEMLHVWNDHLWMAGTQPSIPGLNVPADDDDDYDTEEDLEEIEAQTAVDSLAEKTSALTVQETSENAAASGSSEAALPSPQDVDVIFHLSLLQCISTLPTLLPAGLFPISSSSFYSNHILPSRPIYASSQHMTIQNSSFKKLSKWLKAMEKNGLMKIKENKKDGSVTILSVDQKNPEVLGFSGFQSKTVGEIEAEVGKKKIKEEKKIQATEAKNRQLEVHEYLKASTLPTRTLLEAINLPTDEHYTPASLKMHLNTYITQHNLAHPRDRSVVNLDVVLSQVVLKKGENVEILKRDEVLDRLKGSMTGLHSIRREGEEEVIKKGLPKPIAISVKKRQAKIVTLVTGLEGFLIDPEEFAQELKKICAGASSVSPIHGASPKSPLVEVGVQGSHEKVVTDLLTGKGVPKKWIQIIK